MVLFVNKKGEHNHLTSSKDVNSSSDNGENSTNSETSNNNVGETSNNSNNDSEYPRRLKQNNSILLTIKNLRLYSRVQSHTLFKNLL